MLSGENQDVGEILLYYRTSSNSLNLYKENIVNQRVVDRDYIHLNKTEVREYFYRHLEELEKNAAFNILSALEASFRIDYLIRSKRKHKDPLSRKFRALYKKKERRASLEHDILTLWKCEHPKFKHIISDFIAALNYRNWLAHGRYTPPKLGKNYDVPTIFLISERIYANLPLCVNR